jgi:hypothetical protein
VTRPLRCFASLLFALCGSAAAPAEEPGGTGLEEALERGKVKLALRYRYEGVDDQAVEAPGEASTLGLALGYETKEWKGLAVWVQFENVTDLGLGDRHANGASGSLDNGVRGRPVVADPETTEVNQALLRYRRARTTIEAGRFGLDLGNERFVGTVAWRQNHQSFDGARLEQGIGTRTRLGYSWLAAVNRVTGDGKPMSSHLGYALFPVRPALRLQASVLALDYDRAEDARLSALTAAAGVTAALSSKGWKWRFDAELGWQRDAGRSTTRGKSEARRRVARLSGRRRRLPLRVGVGPAGDVGSALEAAARGKSRLLRRRRLRREHDQGLAVHELELLSGFRGPCRPLAPDRPA